MYVFKISCISDCGSYFAAYLQSVTVIANDKNNALAIVKKWLKDNGKEFIKNESKWDIEKISEEINGVIDYCEDSDY
jgi:hypothetical protein